MMRTFYGPKCKKAKTFFEIKSLNVRNSAKLIWKKTPMFLGFLNFLFVSDFYQRWIYINLLFCFFTLYCLKQPLKFEIIQNSLRNKRCLFANWTDKLAINGPISWTHRTQNISKNQNLNLTRAELLCPLCYEIPCIYVQRFQF